MLDSCKMRMTKKKKKVIRYLDDPCLSRNVRKDQASKYIYLATPYEKWQKYVRIVNKTEKRTEEIIMDF